jgi:hypothetical protein
MDQWLDVELDLDTDAIDERFAGEVVIDEDLTTLARQNVLSLWRSEPERVDLDDGTAAVEIALRCTAHPHPECRFRWVRLTVDFAATPDAQIADLSPRDEVATEPVKLTTTRKAALSFKIESVPLTPSAGYQRVSEQNVYLPSVTASGINLRRAIWTFSAAGESPLHVDRDLRLLLSVPAAASTIPVLMTLRAKVAVTGLMHIIPLLGSRSANFTALRDIAG